MFSFWEVNIYVLCTALQSRYPQSRQPDPSMSIYRIIALTPSCKLGWRGFPCTCCMHKETGPTQQFCLHSYEWKSLMKSYLPCLLTSAFWIKIPSPQTEESFHLYCNKTRSACSSPEVLCTGCCANSSRASWRVFNHICHFLNPFP